MAANVVQLCEDVLTHIQAFSYSYTFTASRQHIAFVRLEDTNDTRVFVYPGTIARAVETRASYRVQAQVFVHLANYINTNSQTEIDNGILFTQELERSIDNIILSDWSMLSYDSDVSGRASFQLEGLGQRNYFHTAIGIQFVALD